MCGIAGLISLNKDRDFLENQIKIMLTSISHRGPDKEGFYIDQSKGLVLGHRRLSIIDLTDNGSQPMHSYNKDLLLSFNGEIYNHLELRSELKKKFSFDNWKSTSDTETLVNYISFFGLDHTLKNIDGMFAFAIYDQKLQKISLVRDIFGEKPLYYGWNNNMFFFASELKSITNIKNFTKDINNKAVSSLLEFCYISDPHSIYQNVFKLAPGQMAVLSLPSNLNSDINTYKKSLKLKKWFSIKDKINSNYNENISVNSIHSIIKKTVQSRLISDAKLGCFLSGGIDSSLIASIISDLSKTKYETFTIGFNNKDYDESSKAKLIANHLGLKNNTLILDEKKMSDIVPKINDIYDEPFADSSQIPTYLLCNFASNFSKVALSGDGGDELFGGYNRYFYTENIWNKVKLIPNPLREHFFKIILHTPNSLFIFIQSIINIFFYNKELKLFSEKIKKLSRKIINSKDKKQLYISFLTEWKTEEIQITPESLNYAELFNETKHENNSFTENMMLFDLITYLPNDILTKVDRASMSNSLEVRAPFLSKELLDLSFSLPINNKIKGKKGKIILKKILNNYLPNELIDLPKQGFGIPLGDWINSSLNEWIFDNINTIKRKKQNFINTDVLLYNLKMHKENNINLSSKLWPAIIFCDWYNKNF